jgi:hypothetical protein
MKRWSECTSEKDRRDTLAEASALCGGNVTATAAILDVDRRTVYALRQRYGDAAPPAEDDAVRITLDLPRACVYWLEREALRRKQEHGARMAKSPIVVELIERAMREPSS